MIKNKKILHLTDFHLHDIDASSKEHFRKDYYEQYLTPLLDIVQKIGKIDCIIATGDFIDRGKENFKNFEHAKHILEYTAKTLFIKNENIGVCIGNHDFDRDLDKKGRFADARKEFFSFADNFSNGNALKHEERYSISFVSDNTYFLSLDATLNRGGKDQPGILTSLEINTIVEAIKEYDNPNNLIIVGSHYPLNYFERTFPTDQDGFFDRHFWRTGELLKERIQSTLRQSPVLWLFGDTHQGAQNIHNNQLFVMSGRIGMKVVDPAKNEYSILSRQANVIEFDSDTSTQVRTIEFKPTGHKDDDQRGEWKLMEAEPYEFRIDTAELIDESIQEDLIKVIKKGKLYKFGRFVINNGEDISLGWVSMNSLLTDSSIAILPAIVRQSRGWIEAKIGVDKNQSTLLIGIDFWGAIIASQLSVATGMRNFIVGSRGDKKNYSLQEVLESSEPELKIDEIKNIIFLTDVVSSGRTIETIHKKLMEKYTDKGLNIDNYIAIAVISDRRQKKKVDLGFLKSFGTFCGNLRIPVVDADMLPDEEILPKKKYF
jgi:pyrimidine operon attenuation protein/uracil phosphoribosyltransferase/predicted phosphodiesterase